MFYSSYTRLHASAKKTATLKCSNDIRDQFSITLSYGNIKLEYPIALIMVDEVALAGGKTNTKNENYYLHTNNSFWTMTPSYFNAAVYANVWLVTQTGNMTFNSVTFVGGIRPVINIRSDVLISSGDGTAENPYQLTLN